MSAATAADQGGRLYRVGRTDFLALLTAQAALTTAQANLATSDALLVDRQVDVFKSLGGGWQKGRHLAAPVRNSSSVEDWRL